MKTKLMDRNLKMRLLGMLMLAVGSVVVMYSILYGSNNVGFWSLYLGMLLITTGLGLLGLNIGSPF
jgi:hypothetical protein